MRILQVILLSIFVICAGAAKASPGFSFVCFDRETTATIDFDLAWETAYLDIDQEELELTAIEGQSDSDGFFAYDNGKYRFSGAVPEGQLLREEQ
ncbi:MAG: hypothetical protein AAGF25_11755, partial [Pseudomonadota bacterium]